MDKAALLSTGENITSDNLSRGTTLDAPFPRKESEVIFPVLLNECVSYFKNNPGFKRAFEGMRKKYLSLGTVGGTLIIQKLNPQEKQALSGFLRRDFLHNAGTTLKFSDFQKALDSTKFKGVRMEDVLKEYFKEELISNSQAQTLYEENRSRFFKEFIEHFGSTPGGMWLQAALSQKEFAYKTLIQRYDSNRDSLLLEISVVCSALNCLPHLRNEKMRLPVFASSIASDPHALDDNTACGQLFIQALAFHTGCIRPGNAFERAELLYKAGILIDEVSNWVLCCGLISFNKDGEVHPGWKGFFDLGEPLQATLLNLSSLEKVTALSGRVYVVENPSVFSSVLDKARSMNKETNRNISLVCTYGQINLAALVLLDLLAASCSEIWYSGDFDPEGIVIADKLKLRYGNTLKLWRYSYDDYQSALSDRVLDQSRLKQLEGVISPQLRQLVQAVKTQGQCGYQEMILERLTQDVFSGCY